MRVAICTDQYLPLVSGLVDSVCALAEALRARGHEVRIYTPSIRGAVPEPNVYRFPSWSLPGSEDSITASFPRGAMDDMRKFKPDIIQTELFGVAGFLALYAAHRMRKVLVGTDHTFPADYLHYLKLDFPPFPYLSRKYAAWYYNRCDFVTTPSKKMLEELRIYGMRRPARVVSNPIPKVFRVIGDKAEIKKRLGIGRHAIAVFGRVAVEKNLDVALDVFADIAKRSDAELLFIGDGEYRSALTEKVRRHPFGARVKFLGTLRGESLVETLNACDVLLITSRSENQPMTMLQALACGVPVVGAAAGGIPEYIVDGENGFSVPPDNVMLFAERVLDALDEKRAQALHKASRKSVEQFSQERMAGEFEALYTELIHGKSKKSGP